MRNLELLFKAARRKNIEVLLRTDTQGYFLHVYTRDSNRPISVYQQFGSDLDSMVEAAILAVSLA